MLSIKFSNKLTPKKITILKKIGLNKLNKLTYYQVNN